MNITTQVNNLPLATVVNPPTDNLRRENSTREVITQPSASQQSAAEKGVASERERARNPGQNGDAIDFAAIQEQAEKDSSTISERESRNPQDQAEDGSQSSEQEASDGNESNTEPSHEHDDVQDEPSPREEFERQQQINELQQRDLEVRSHEFAHASVGGAHTGAPSFSFEVGPDGKKYAVEGSVSVDLSPVEGNPRATIAKMQKVHAAALAPANPSAQDTKVANSAAKIITQAQAQLLDEQLADEKAGTSTARTQANNIPSNDSFSIDEQNEKSDDFDQFVQQTLDSQEAISPSRDNEIDQRALRIESFYSDINQAYEREPRSQFELRA